MPLTGSTGRHVPREGVSLSKRHEQALCDSFDQPLLGGNQVDLLQDGPQIYAAMLGAIDAARDRCAVCGRGRACVLRRHGALAARRPVGQRRSTFAYTAFGCCRRRALGAVRQGHRAPALKFHAHATHCRPP
jgi:hypothetical protein